MSNKKSKFGGKQILLLGLVALVVAAGYYRWTVENDKLNEAVPTVSEVKTKPTEAEAEQKKENGEQPKEGENPQGNQGGTENITKLKQSRDSARSQSVEEYKKMSQDKEASQENRKNAEKKVAMENDFADKERKIETQVKAKGYNDCIAYVDEGGVSVTVEGGEIDGAKVSQIKDIVVSVTNVSVKNIKINAI